MPYIRFELWTTQFLGTTETGNRILTALEEMDGGRWMPDRWGSVEPVRKVYSHESRSKILEEWAQDRPKGSGKVYNCLFLRKKKPELDVTVWAARLNRPDMNVFIAEFEAKPFSGPDGLDRVAEIFRTWIEIADASWGAVRSSRQANWRVAQGTPMDRLRQVEWLNFFGNPYVRLIGEERIRTCPGCEVEEVAGRGFLVRLNGRFDSPEITESAEPFLAVERHLGQALFAGYGYPQTPCIVPDFDVSDLIVPGAPWPPATQDTKPN